MLDQIDIGMTSKSLSVTLTFSLSSCPSVAPSFSSFVSEPKQDRENSNSAATTACHMFAVLQIQIKNFLIVNWQHAEHHKQQYIRLAYYNIAGTKLLPVLK